MTKKHYVKLAIELKAFKVNTSVKEFDYKTLVENLCVIFRTDNPNFDRLRFIEACN